MFRDLIESIRTEAAQRGQLDKYSQPGEGRKLVKKGAARFARQAAKKELKGYTPDKDVNIPRRSTRGYES